MIRHHDQPAVEQAWASAVLAPCAECRQSLSPKEGGPNSSASVLVVALAAAVVARTVAVTVTVRVAVKCNKKK